MKFGSYFVKRSCCADFNLVGIHALFAFGVAADAYQKKAGRGHCGYERKGREVLAAAGYAAGKF